MNSQRVLGDSLTENQRQALANRDYMSRLHRPSNRAIETTDFAPFGYSPTFTELARSKHLVLGPPRNNMPNGPIAWGKSGER